jgi:hypothetical protein
MLSVAKHLGTHSARPFATLRVTRGGNQEALTEAQTQDSVAVGRFRMLDHR